MRHTAIIVLPAALCLLAGCGESGSGASTTGAPSAKPTGTAAATGTATASAAPGATLPEGIVPVAKLVEVVAADAKGVTGKKVQIEGTYWGMSKETSEGKTTYVLEIVASKDDTKSKATCYTTEEPKDLPAADNQAHDQAIPVTAEGTIEVSMSGKPRLKECTYKKK